MIIEHIRKLHDTYCRETGQQPPYNTCERRWFDYQKLGFTVEDLKLVIAHVKRLNKLRDADYQLSLRFDRIIGDCERFGDLLGDARAYERQRLARVVTNKQQVMNDFRGTETPPSTTPQALSARDALRAALDKLP